MALEIKFEGPDPMKALEVWIEQQDPSIGIEACCYYFYGDHTLRTLRFWYEEVPVEAEVEDVIILNQVLRRQGAPR